MILMHVATIVKTLDIIWFLCYSVQLGMPVSKGNNFKLIKKHIKHGKWYLLIIKGMNIILEGSSVISSCSTL